MANYLLDQETYDTLRENLRSLEIKEAENKQLISETKKILDNAIVIQKEDDTVNIGDIVEIIYDQDYASPELIRIVAIPMGNIDGIVEASIGSEVGSQLIGKRIGEPIQLKNGMTITVRSKLNQEPKQTR